MSSKKVNLTVEIAKESQLISCGIYEKMSKTTIGGKKKWKASKKFIEGVLDDMDEFKDTDFVADNQKLAPLLNQNAQIAKFMVWYRLHKFFQKNKYVVFNKMRMTGQVIHNRGYVYLIDAMNTLSVQPGLIWRLFERKKTPREGIYPVWLNVNGEWTNMVLDDQVPIYGDKDSKTKFFFTSPNNTHREIWHVLLEKAVAKAYGGYERLHCGLENWMIRDLTGAPQKCYDVAYIAPNRAIGKREREHMESLWQRMFRNLRKGYIMSTTPRLPSQVEKQKNKNLNVPNKKYYLSKGIYSGHNYAVVTIREVVDSRGGKARIIKLRNPWIGEVWQGDWSHTSDLWTPELRQILDYNPDIQGHSECWMDLKSFMGYFEAINIYKTIPDYLYNSLNISAHNCAFYRTVVRISVPAKGKYTFSVNQKDIRSYSHNGLSYSPIKLTLGQIEHDQFKLLSHTSTQKSRNTFIRKRIEKGEYYLLIEKDNSVQMQNLCSKNPKTFGNFHDLSVSSYGPRTCGLKTISDKEKNNFVFDYLSYFGWKGFSEQRIGQKVTDCNINFHDGSWNNVSLYILSIPDTIIYAFKNENNFGVEVKSKLGGIFNKEIVGPEGRKGFEQEFSMNSNCTDVFILRDLEFSEPGNPGLENGKFKINSVVGRKFIGEKENPDSFSQLKTYLMDYKGSRKQCEVEKRKGGKAKIGVFDIFNGFKKIEEKNEIVHGKIKKYTQAMKVEDYQDLVDMEDVELLQEVHEAEYARVREVNAKMAVQKNKILQKKINRLKGIHDMPQDPNHNESFYEESESIIEFAEDENVLQLGNPEMMLEKINNNGGSILKNNNYSAEQEQQNLEILQHHVDSVEVMDEKELASVLVLKGNQLLLIENDKLKQLLKYFGVQAFVSIYGIDNQMLGKIVEKLGGNNPATQRTLGQKIMNARMQDPAQDEMARKQQEEFDNLRREQEELENLKNQKMKLLKQQEEQQRAIEQHQQQTDQKTPMDFLSLDHAFKYAPKTPDQRQQQQPQPVVDNNLQAELEEQKRLEIQIQQHMQKKELDAQMKEMEMLESMKKEMEMLEQMKKEAMMKIEQKNQGPAQLSPEEQQLQDMLEQEREQQELLEQRLRMLTNNGQPLGESPMNIDNNQNSQQTQNQKGGNAQAIFEAQSKDGVENNMMPNNQFEQQPLKVGRMKIDADMPVIDRAHRLRPETNQMIQEKIQRKLDEIRRVQNNQSSKVSGLVKYRDRSAQPNRDQFVDQGRSKSIDPNSLEGISSKKFRGSFNQPAEGGHVQEALKKEKEKLDEIKKRLEKRKNERMKYQEEYHRKKNIANEIENDRKHQQEQKEFYQSHQHLKYNNKTARGSTPGHLPIRSFKNKNTRGSYNPINVVENNTGDYNYQQKLQEFKHQAEVEKQQQVEQERQRQTEMEQKRIVDFERQKQNEMDRQRIAEIERSRRIDAENQRIDALERQREAELDRQRRIDIENQRIDALERQRVAEGERQRQIILEDQRMAEIDRQRQIEMENHRIAEIERSRAIDIENKRIAKMERQRNINRENQRIVELERQRKIDQESLRLDELERQKSIRASKMERQRTIDQENKRIAEMERQRNIDRENMRIAEIERQRNIEMENQRIVEQERQKQAEMTQRTQHQHAEMDRQRQAEINAQNEIKRLEEQRKTIEHQNSVRKQKEESHMKTELRKRLDLLRNQHFMNQPEAKLDPKAALNSSYHSRMDSTQRYNTVTQAELTSINTPKSKRMHRERDDLLRGSGFSNTQRMDIGNTPASNLRNDPHRKSNFNERSHQHRSQQQLLKPSGSKTERYPESSIVSQSIGETDFLRQTMHSKGPSRPVSRAEYSKSIHQNVKNVQKNKADRLLNTLQEKIKKNKKSLRDRSGYITLAEPAEPLQLKSRTPYKEQRRRLGSFNQDVSTLNKNNYSSNRALKFHRDTDSRPQSRATVNDFHSTDPHRFNSTGGHQPVQSNRDLFTSRHENPKDNFGSNRDIFKKLTSIQKSRPTIENQTPQSMNRTMRNQLSKYNTPAPQQARNDLVSTGNRTRRGSPNGKLTVNNPNLQWGQTVPRGNQTAPRGRQSPAHNISNRNMGTPLMGMTEREPPKNKRTNREFRSPPPRLGNKNPGILRGFSNRRNKQPLQLNSPHKTNPPLPRNMQSPGMASPRMSPAGQVNKPNLIRNSHQKPQNQGGPLNSQFGANKRNQQQQPQQQQQQQAPPQQQQQQQQNFNLGNSMLRDSNMNKKLAYGNRPKKRGGSSGDDKKGFWNSLFG